MNLSRPTLIPWTSLDFAFKSGGSNNDLGDLPLPHSTFFATRLISNYMTKRDIVFLPQDKDVLRELFNIDGFPINSPTMIIDPTQITRSRYDNPNRNQIANRPWFTPGGKFLLVPTICVYNGGTVNEALGIYQVNFYYLPHTFNATPNYLDLKDQNGHRICNTGHTSAGQIRQIYYLPLLETKRNDLLGKNSQELTELLLSSTAVLPSEVRATASIG